MRLSSVPQTAGRAGQDDRGQLTSRWPRAKFGLTEDQCVVGFVGRLDRAKGADLLIEAAAVLHRTQETCAFLLIGEGSERKRLSEHIRSEGLEGMVTLVGLQENPAEIMRAFDVAVVPSRREAFGIAALELMRMRVPVIVSPVGGLPELVENGRTGIVLPQLTPTAIAEAIQSLRADASRRQEMAQMAFERASSFDARGPAEQMVAVYEEIACPQ